MTNPNIKEDVDFVIRAIDNPKNKSIHLKPLKNLIKNFQKKWYDLMGPGVADFYINLLNKKYQNDLQHSKINERLKDR
tara:strand:+ start:222 stop:455 length:234 start_codon:yes stop_codon:yes gene_type:complete